jgi:hypothetical protein
MLGRDIPSHFHVPIDQTGCKIDIIITGTNKEMMKRLMQSIEFVGCEDLEFTGEPTDINIATVSRRVHVKSKRVL